MAGSRKNAQGKAGTAGGISFPSVWPGLSYIKGWIERSVFGQGVFLPDSDAFVNVNYDLTEYLPASARSCIGLDLMEDEFGYPGTARLMMGCEPV